MLYLCNPMITGFTSGTSWYLSKHHSCILSQHKLSTFRWPRHLSKALCMVLRIRGLLSKQSCVWGRIFSLQWMNGHWRSSSPHRTPKTNWLFSPKTFRHFLDFATYIWLHKEKKRHFLEMKGYFGASPIFLWAWEPPLDAPFSNGLCFFSLPAQLEFWLALLRFQVSLPPQEKGNFLGFKCLQVLQSGFICSKNAKVFGHHMCMVKIAFNSSLAGPWHLITSSKADTVSHQPKPIWRSQLTFAIKWYFIWPLNLGGNWVTMNWVWVLYSWISRKLLPVVSLCIFKFL